MSTTKNMPLNCTMKKMRKIWIIFDIENWHFLIARFRADVDLTKKFFYEKMLFFTQLSGEF